MTAHFAKRNTKFGDGESGGGAEFLSPNLFSFPPRPRGGGAWGGIRAGFSFLF